MKKNHITSILVAFLLLNAGVFYFVSHRSQNAPIQAQTAPQAAAPTPASIKAPTQKVAENDTLWINNEVDAIEPQASNLNAKVLKLSLIAYEHAREKGVVDNNLLTIIDYSKPSDKRRLWVVDLAQEKVLFNTWVAHGKNSGGLEATSFSNSFHSLKSSIGVYVTGSIYTGEHGESLHVHGLEPGFNSNAYDRAIEIHSANYVSKDLAEEGRIGRSWGCMAVSTNVIHPLIDTLKSHSLIVAYYPDQQWLNHSSYLT